MREWVTSLLDSLDRMLDECFRIPSPHITAHNNAQKYYLEVAEYEMREKIAKLQTQIVCLLRILNDEKTNRFQINCDEETSFSEINSLFSQGKKAILEKTECNWDISTASHSSSFDVV